MQRRITQISLAAGLAVVGLSWGCSSSDGPTSVRTMQERGVILGLLSSSVSVETPHGRVSSGTLASSVTWHSRKAGAAAFESSPLSGDAVFKGAGPTTPLSMIGKALPTRDVAVSRSFKSARGREVTMYLGGESGTPEKQQPPRLTYHYVNGKLTDAIEAQYKKRDGRWIAFSGRMIVFDSGGKNHSEVKFDLNAQEQQAVIIRTSPLTLHGRTAMTALASLFGPRELYAQEGGIAPDVMPEEACGVICSTAAAEAARALALSSQATKLTFECITGDLPSCLEVQSAITEAALAVSSAATWAASCYKCLNPPKPPAPPALPPGGGGSGYCVYRITYYADTGEIISTELLYCF